MIKITDLFSPLRLGSDVHLVNDVYPVAELLPLQERMQVVEQELEVVLSVSVGDDDGRLVPRQAVRRPVASSAYHQRVFPLHLGQSEPRREADMDRPPCEHTLKPVVSTSSNQCG